MLQLNPNIIDDASYKCCFFKFPLHFNAITKEFQFIIYVNLKQLPITYT